MNYKDIHVGSKIKEIVEQGEYKMERICNYFKCTEQDIIDTFKKKSLDAEHLLKWSKILEYDFFRMYSQHLILFSPPKGKHANKPKEASTTANAEFRKNIYTQEVIDFIMELIITEQKTKVQVMQDYNIPKSTLYRWITKYKN